MNNLINDTMDNLLFPNTNYTIKNGKNVIKKIKKIIFLEKYQERNLGISLFELFTNKIKRHDFLKFNSTFIKGDIYQILDNFDELDVKNGSTFPEPIFHRNGLYFSRPHLSKFNKVQKFMFSILKSVFDLTDKNAYYEIFKARGLRNAILKICQKQNYTICNSQRLNPIIRSMNYNDSVDYYVTEN